jgi:GNAT superfamily N-acetyltransferase
MNDILRDFSTPAVERAIEENLCALFSLLNGNLPQAEVHDEPEMLWTVTDTPIALFNIVLRARLSPANVDAAIERAIHRGKSRNIPIAWWIGRATRPPDLGTRLEAHGFTREGNEPGMAVDISSLPEDIPTPPGLTIELVQDIETLKKWNRVITIGFGMSDLFSAAFATAIEGIGFTGEPPFYNYLGCLNNEPVATASLFLAAGVAGIYCVATVPDARRKGIAIAMTFKALAESRRRGYRVGVLQASEMGVNVYPKLGFRQYFDIDHYVWVPEPAGHE